MRSLFLCGNEGSRCSVQVAWPWGSRGRLSGKTFWLFSFLLISVFICSDIIIISLPVSLCLFFFLSPPPFFSGWKVFFLHPDVALFSHRPAQWPLGRCCPRAGPADLGPGAVWDPGGFSSEVLKSATLLQKTPSDQVPDKRIVWKPAVFNIRTVVIFFNVSGGHWILSSFKWFHSPLFIPSHPVPQTIFQFVCVVVFPSPTLY